MTDQKIKSPLDHLQQFTDELTQLSLKYKIVLVSNAYSCFDSLDGKYIMHQNGDNLQIKWEDKEMRVWAHDKR